ncbi:universal stress protein [Neorhodopirellula lusitana]|uniref:universal stress protein n=1 Tax=Neorhodopirellula lusitana TaxID=445327 RepID=UPI0038516FCB
MDDTNDLDREVDDSMRMFEKAHVGSTSPITPIRPARVLLVLDGSDQDSTSVASAVYLQGRHNTETLILDARDSGGQAGEESGAPVGKSELATQTVAKVGQSRAIERVPGDAFDAILQALAAHQIDLLIVPCPFGRSFEKVGLDSAGTVIDVLLSRCPVPMLVTRRADQTLANCTKRVCVLVSSECDVQTRAAGWAFGMSADGAEVSLNIVVEKEQFENVRVIMEAMRPGETFDEATLSDVMTKTHQSLHSAMNATASQLGMRYHLIPQAGKTAPPNPLSDPHEQLLVVPLEVDDRFTQGFVQDRIRRSPHPVLVVPGHVRSDGN